VGAAYAIFRLFRHASRVPVTRRHLRVDFSVMRQILDLSGSATLQNLIGMASWIGLVRILAGYGSDALAGYTIAVRLIIFALLPSWGLSNAAATMVGQSLGARKPERAEASVWRAGRYNAYFLTAVGILFFVAAPLILKAFTSDPTVSGYAIHCLRVVALGYPLYAYGMVLTQSFNGAGDTWTPTLLNLVIFWLFEIPLAYVLARRLAWGPAGVFWAIAVSFSALAVVSAVLFRRGKWKTSKV
jgi:Na+-driven multidrug efflux pump